MLVATKSREVQPLVSLTNSRKPFFPRIGMRSSLWTQNRCSGHRIVSAIPERIAFSATHSGGANNWSITGHHHLGRLRNCHRDRCYQVAKRVGDSPRGMATSRFPGGYDGQRLSRHRICSTTGSDLPADRAGAIMLALPDASRRCAHRHRCSSTCRCPSEPCVGAFVRRQ